MNTCSTCKFFSALKSQCRKNPPVPFLIGANAQGQPMIVSVFPPTTKDDICGEWLNEHDPLFSNNHQPHHRS